MQVKHLQGEFEESRGAFISPQGQGGGGGGARGGAVVLKLRSLSFLKDVFLRLVCAQFSLPGNIFPLSTHCVSVCLLGALDLYNEGKRCGVCRPSG